MITTKPNKTFLQPLEKKCRSDLFKEAVWARLENYEAVTNFVLECAGTYRIEINYAKTMLCEK